MKHLSSVFKINGEVPVDLSPTQRELFDLILYRKHRRSIIIMPTQYGKSFTVAQALIYSAAICGDRFTILAPSEKKALIIMHHVIEHSFDDPMFRDRLELDKAETLDRLRRERSRTNLTYQGGGGIQVLTLDARNGKRNIEAAMGFGGPNLILDESSLVPDNLYATVKRMMGGYAYRQTFMLEIGNPFYPNHFKRTAYDPRYFRIWIDYKVALKEGRFDPEFIDEMRAEAFFDVFYECKFPSETAIDERGYRQLLTMEQIEEAMIDSYEEPTVEDEKGKTTYPDGPLKLGGDIAAGGDKNVYTLRNNVAAWIDGENQSNDTMTNVAEVQRIKGEHSNLETSEIYLDDIGVGKGCTDRLKELDYAVNGVSVGESPITEEAQRKYKNQKAEAYWEVKMWIEKGGKLVRHKDWYQLTWIKYKINSDKVIQIEPKQELKKRTGKSPDHAESLMLTFVKVAKADVWVI